VLSEPDPAAKASRRTKRVALAVSLAVLVLIGVGVTLIVTSGPSSSAAARTARLLVRAALKSTIDGGSFHYVSTFTSQGQTQTTVGDAGVSSGKQVITIGSDSFSVLVIGTACYFQGDARQMVDQLGLPLSIATPHAGQWISLAPGDLPYQSVYAAVTTHSALDDNIAFAPHQESGTSTRAGYRVLGITGPMTSQFVDGALQRAKGTASLYITASRPHLPVQYTEDGKIDKVASKLVMTFSRWGEAVSVTAPRAAVTYLSLGGGNGTTPTTGPPVLTSAPG
jgi:hypothetical protein